jgi:transcription-repair coupling factor (superfamily II helicase)
MAPGPLSLEPLTSAPVAVDLPIAASIPSEYVTDRGLRLRIYRRLADLRDEAALDEIRQELAERFGPPPAPVENLLYQLQVKILASHAGVTAIGTENGQIVLTIPALGEVDQTLLGVTLGPGARVSKTKVWLGRAGEVRAPTAAWRAPLLDILRQLATVTPEPAA